MFGDRNTRKANVHERMNTTTVASLGLVSPERQLMGVTQFFLEKKSDDLLSAIALCGKWWPF